MLRLVSLDEAIRANSAFETGDFFDETMIRREAKVLQFLKAAPSDWPCPNPVEYPLDGKGEAAPARIPGKPV